MKTDTEIRTLGYQALETALGTVEAERFITLVLREPFDYTAWRQNLWEGQDVRTISAAAAAHRAAAPTQAP